MIFNNMSRLRQRRILLDYIHKVTMFSVSSNVPKQQLDYYRFL